jgi:predicted adenine nucleotide alpha hydrolase (AANH) superfamily ATPase
MPRVLLHACCGPCAAHAVEELRRRGHEVTLCFSNANLAPDAEFTRRLEAARQLAEAMNAPLLVDPPDHAAWLSAVGAHADAPEGGARCRLCFAYALRRVQEMASRAGFDFFTTSLTISPHKRSALIFEIGRAIGGAHFLAVDFKKDGGFQRGVALAKAHGLYRQNYCGCEFSARATAQSEKATAGASNGAATAMTRA